MRPVHSQKFCFLMPEAILGVFLYAFAYRFFILPFHLYNGGFTGLAQILQSLLIRLFSVRLPLDISGLILWGLNIPLFFLISGIISKKFLVRTIITVLCQTFFMLIIPTPEKPLLNDCLASCLIGGAISGFGAGLTLKAGSCGGGSDIVGLFCSIKYPRFSVGKFNLLLNTCIYIYGAYDHELSTAAYSFIFSTIAAFVMDRVHYQNIMTNVIIISHCSAIGSDILQKLNRGYTFWEGYGGFTQTPIFIYLTVVSKKETTFLKKIIVSKDPQAFVTFTDHSDVLGNFEKRFDQ